MASVARQGGLTVVAKGQLCEDDWAALGGPEVSGRQKATKVFLVGDGALGPTETGNDREHTQTNIPVVFDAGLAGTAATPSRRQSLAGKVSGYVPLLLSALPVLAVQSQFAPWTSSPQAH